MTLRSSSAERLKSRAREWGGLGSLPLLAWHRLPGTPSIAPGCVAAWVRVAPSRVLTGCTPVPPGSQAREETRCQRRLPVPVQTSSSGLLPSGQLVPASALHPVSGEPAACLHPRTACLADNRDTAGAWCLAQKVPDRGN